MNIGSSGAYGAGPHPALWTTCGREIRVGHLVLGGSRHPAQRVT